MARRAVADGRVVVEARGAACDAGVVVDGERIRRGAGQAGAACDVETGRTVGVAGDTLARAVVVGGPGRKAVHPADACRWFAVGACRTLNAVELGRAGARLAVGVALEAGVLDLVVARVAVVAGVGGVRGACFAGEVAGPALVGERPDEQRVRRTVALAEPGADGGIVGDESVRLEAEACVAAGAVVLGGPGAGLAELVAHEALELGVVQV